MPSSISIVRGREAQNLTKALRKLIEQRDAEIEQIRQKYQSDINAMETALAALTGDPSETAQVRLPRKRRWISDEKLEAVRQYLIAHERARQADIATDLELNSGSVSTALRVLLTEGDPRSPEVEVRELGIERGSREWEYLLLPQAKAKSGGGRLQTAA